MRDKQRNERTTGRKLVRGVFFLIVFGWVGHMTTQYFIRDAAQSKFFLHKIQEAFAITDFWHLALNVHIGTACLAIITGALSFLLLNSRNWRLHKGLGILYSASVLISALISYYLATRATGGLTSVVAFFALNTLWLFATLRTYVLIKRRQVSAHRRWSIRSYALTLANISLHLLLSLLTQLTGDYIESYRLSVWLGWLLNLAAAEWIIRRRRGTTIIA